MLHRIRIQQIEQHLGNGEADEAQEKIAESLRSTSKPILRAVLIKAEQRARLQKAEQLARDGRIDEAIRQCRLVRNRPSSGELLRQAALQLDQYSTSRKKSLRQRNELRLTARTPAEDSDDELQARRQLRLARYLLDRNPSAAKRRLVVLSRTFPETEAAAEVAPLLAKMN